MTQLDHWDRNTVRFLNIHLKSAIQTIRIATGFFTIQGYNLLRHGFEDKRIFLLVGFDENSAERLKAKMVEDIMAHLARWNEQDRREAVLDLVRKIQAGELQIVEREIVEIIDARIRRGDHAKLYVLDDNLVLVGSSNLTVNGLRFNYEAVSGNDDPTRVGQWMNWFQGYWDAEDTYDLTQALLEALLRWLDFALPYDIYLKTILALVREDETVAPRGSYKMPVAYQQVVVERMLRQLKAYGGAFLVASTGLGKTIMATHTAYRLRVENEILNVLVFAPKQVRPDWERVLKSAGISFEIFTRDLLDQPANKRNHRVRHMLNAMESIDEKYIIFIDESQRFRNRINATGDRERFSFERLADVIERKNPKVILLTATPFAKGIDDLNNQLFLLPHTAPRNTTRDDGQMVFDIMANDLLDPHAWRVRDSDEFFEEFMNLPVCTVISTSQVAKSFATETGEGEYIDFGEQRRWLPQIEIRKIKVPLPLEIEMSQALDEGYFKHEMMSFKSRIGFQRTEATVEQNATVAWMSSPLSLREVVHNTIEDLYKVQFVRPQSQRRSFLGNILQELDNMRYEDDQKLLALVIYLEQFLAGGQKVIIFTERLATASYLEQAIQHFLPNARVANVVQETETGYELRDFDNEVYDLILDFAPEANSDKIGDRKMGATYDIFITTDAYSAGVNLQDASVVINYDISWTPETIIQRAGRILRFWTKPRMVSLYIFVGAFVHDIERQHTSLRVEERIRRLVQRARHAEKFSELPLIPEGDSAAYASLGNLTNVTIEDLGFVDLSEIEEFSGVSRFLTHITELNQNSEYARQIPDDITSALAYAGNKHFIYLLLRHQNEFAWTLYDIKKQRLVDLKEDALLELLKCDIKTVPAPIDPQVVEVEAQKAKNLWIQEMDISIPEAVERICALYLLPQNSEDGTGFNL
ncbi:hypothetical protein MASR2M15_05220 [Anaerolineales bacterium]